MKISYNIIFKEYRIIVIVLHVKLLKAETFVNILD